MNWKNIDLWEMPEETDAQTERKDVEPALEMLPEVFGADLEQIVCNMDVAR